VRTLIVIGGAALVVAGAAAVVSTVDPQGTEPAAGTTDTVEATARVRRGDLVETSSTSGSLEYADSRDLAAEGAGTVTWLPRSGRVVRQGEALYRVDTVPVVRLDGSVPAWRALGPDLADSDDDSDGADVRQLEDALVAMGYGDDWDLAADGDWTWATTEAVEDWQEDLGLEENGELPLGSVVFTDGDLRVAGQLVDVGARVQPGTGVLEVSSAERRVTVSLETTQRHLAPIGAAVTLDFPDGTTARGRVTDVEVVPAEDEQSSETLAVTVTPHGKASERKVARQLDGASVLVSLTDTLAEDVLIVPVTALLAVADGGYAVEVVTDGGTRTVPVTTEAFGDSSVAVSGDLHPGDEVVVAP
jgi:hypothetical protein